ncbi:MAG: tetratricopeptide repeat protein [Drouetiella hepatica Uher 2000/2452]|jgi:Flp pilus assembly protein TadD|uniref:Tetratricopeptide repeat protein n=1 Tax=Drouetiella hepatica Uher 2000/2452 TaxID=904376 RepID=A0A951UQ52_9CYAN|nr:tetratricopeptide repeat protein [Drouetiella hepatica Uher 2000/2452]
MPTSQLLDSDRAVKAKALFTEGVDQSRQGDYAGAIESFDQALQLNSENADAYGHRCVARHRLGNCQGAIADCQQAAMLYLKQGKPEKHQYALKMLQKLQMSRLEQNVF